MLTDLQRDALRVVTELSDAGTPVSTVALSRELDVPYHEAVRTAQGLAQGGHLAIVGGIWLSPLTRVEPPPDDAFVGFFEDVELVEEFHRPPSNLK